MGVKGRVCSHPSMLVIDSPASTGGAHLCFNVRRSRHPRTPQFPIWKWGSMLRFCSECHKWQFIMNQTKKARWFFIKGVQGFNSPSLLFLLSTEHVPYAMWSWWQQGAPKRKSLSRWLAIFCQRLLSCLIVDSRPCYPSRPERGEYRKLRGNI